MSCLTFMLVLLCGLTHAAELQSSERPVEEDCAIDGWGDFYGPGVRIGIYIVWFSSWLANNFLAEEIIGTLETNSIFLLALFSTVFTLSMKHEGIRVIDVIIIHQFCTGFLFSVMSLWGYRTMYYKTEGPGGRRHFGHFGTHFRLILMTMVTAFGVWFLCEEKSGKLSEIDMRTQCGGLVTFFFVPMNVQEEWTRLFHLSLSILYVIYYGSMMIAAIGGVTYYLVQRLRGQKITWDLIEKPDSETSLTKRELTKMHIAVSAFNLFWIVFTITNIENTMRLNHMQGVIWFVDLNPGQLLPLLIGIVSLMRISYIIIRNKLGFNHDHETPTQPALYSNIAPTEGLALTVQKAATGHSSHKGPRRHLTHRFFLAWFPWLHLFSFFRQPIDVIPFYSRHGTPQNIELKFEPMKPVRTKTVPVIRPESPDEALLEPSPPLRTSEGGSSGDEGEGEERTRTVPRDSRFYAREGYDSDGY